VISGIGSPFQQGVAGLQNSSQGIYQAATQINQATTVENGVANTSDVIEPIIEMKQQQLLFDASAQVVKTADQALGALLDTKA